MRKSSATFAGGSDADNLDLLSGEMSPTPLNVDLKHPIDEQPQVQNLAQLLESQELDLKAFAIPKLKINPKIQYDAWGNPYKPTGIPKSESQKASRPTSKPKSLILKKAKEEAALSQKEALSSPKSMTSGQQKMQQRLLQKTFDIK